MTTSIVVVCMSVVVVMGAMGALLIWRQTNALQDMAGGNVRARDRERHDHDNKVERLLEKLWDPDLRAISNQHGNERLRQAEIDARTEAFATREPAIINAAPEETCSPADAVHMQ